MNTLDLLRANHRKALDLAEQAVQERDAAYKALSDCLTVLQETTALINNGDSDAFAADALDIRVDAAIQSIQSLLGEK